MSKPQHRKLLFFLGGILLCLGLLACRETAPEIISIEPRIGSMGDIVTIYGTGFGDERYESYITIAGTPPTTSSYISWNDMEISFRVPEFGDAGLVYVHRGRSRSNPALLANQTTMPVLVRTEAGNGPLITSIEPASGPIGSLITIQGNNFGSSRNTSGVFFSWNAEASAGTAAGTEAPDFIETSEEEFGYELWGEREIRVRVPDGAVSGNLEVRTHVGNSRPVYFEITGSPGTKAYRDKRTYTLSYLADIQIAEAHTPNSLYVWMPRPAMLASQRNVTLLSRNIEPFIENYRGTSLYHFIDILPGNRWEIALSYVVEVYAIETSIRNQAPVRLNRPSPVRAANVLPSPLIPSNEPAIRTQAATIIGREAQPLARASMIYQWLISSLEIQNFPGLGGALEALSERTADSYRAALLFCALARAVDIPAIPVAGVLVNRQRNATKHYWAEFWLDGFGWVPLDPTLGAGAAPQDFNLREDFARYYFGNMDNQRITFSRGERFLYQMTPRGRTVQRSREFSLQNLWEEAIGGLESYSSLWSDVTITGVY